MTPPAQVETIAGKNQQTKTHLAVIGGHHQIINDDDM
jgi:hypothetical protein